MQLLYANFWPIAWWGSLQESQVLQICWLWATYCFVIMESIAAHLPNVWLNVQFSLHKWLSTKFSTCSQICQQAVTWITEFQVHQALQCFPWTSCGLLIYGHEFVVSLGWCMSFNFQCSFASDFKHGKTIAFIVPELFDRTKNCEWLEKNNSSFVLGFSGLLCVEWAIFRVSSFSHQICGSFLIWHILYSYLNPLSGADDSAGGVIAAWHWPLSRR
jgi:hypothetical protein